MSFGVRMGESLAPAGEAVKREHIPQGEASVYVCVGGTFMAYRILAISNPPLIHTAFFTKIMTHFLQLALNSADPLSLYVRVLVYPPHQKPSQ